MIKTRLCFMIMVENILIYIINDLGSTIGAAFLRFVKQFMYYYKKLQLKNNQRWNGFISARTDNKTVKVKFRTNNEKLIKTN